MATQMDSYINDIKKNLELINNIKNEFSIASKVDFQRLDTNESIQDYSREFKKQHNLSIDFSTFEKNVAKLSTALTNKRDSVLNHSQSQFVRPSTVMDASYEDSRPSTVSSSDLTSSASKPTTFTSTNETIPEQESSSLTVDTKQPSSSSAALKTIEGTPTQEDLFHSPETARHYSIYKEARLERMKNIRVTYHLGLPEEFFKAIGRSLRNGVEIKRRYYKLKMYKDCFLGSDAVNYLIDYEFAVDEKEALQLGNKLIALGYVEHISHNSSKNLLVYSSSHFYRFTPSLNYVEEENSSNIRISLDSSNYRESLFNQRVALQQARGEDGDATEREKETMSDLQRLSESTDEVHALISYESLLIISRILNKVFIKRNKLLYYKGHIGCFLGVEVVATLRELKIATNLIDAIVMGQALLDEKLIMQIGGEKSNTKDQFQNKYLFYKFTKALEK